MDRFKKISNSFKNILSFCDDNKTIAISFSTCDHIYEQTYKNTIKRQNRLCLACTGREKLSQNDIITAMNNNHGINNYIILFQEGINKKDRLVYQCCICETVITTNIYNSLTHGCNTCINRKITNNLKKSIDDFETYCAKKFNKQFIYFQDYNGMRNSIKILCTKCNQIYYQRADVHYHQSKGCKFCEIRSLNGIIAKLLLENNIIFETEKTFSDLKGINNKSYRYDFYLPIQNTVIEIHGIQHYEHTYFFQKDIDDFYSLHIRDRKKHVYAINNNINYIEIAYTGINKYNEILSAITTYNDGFNDMYNQFEKYGNYIPRKIVIQ